jgi:2-phosphoglycerate kinase
VQPDSNLRDRLAHVRWIGGGSGAGKSTVAAALAVSHGLITYATDASIRAHVARTSPNTHPLLHAFVAMDMDQRWVDRSPEEMLQTFHGFRGEAFELIVEDLLGLSSGPVLAEGFRLLPRLVAPLLRDERQAVWLLPTPRFRRSAFAQRGTTGAMVASTRDPVRALENLLQRDALFTDEVRADVSDLGLEAIEVDLGDTPADVTERVRVALALGG